jgi:hypothetical protein
MRIGPTAIAAAPVSIALGIIGGLVWWAVGNPATIPKGKASVEARDSLATPRRMDGEAQKTRPSGP